MSVVEPFERVVEAHGTVVLRVCRALLGPHDADDAWSETFLAALQAYPGLRPGSNVRGWLVTIAHRKSLDIIRAQTRTSTSDDSDVGWGSAPAEEGRHLDLVAALRTLTDRQRTAVVLHHLGGVPFTDVATELDCSPAAARRASADGIAALRTALVPNESHTHPVAQNGDEHA